MTTNAVATRRAGLWVRLQRRWVLLAGVGSVLVGAAAGYLAGERRATEDRAAALRDIDTYTNVLQTARGRRDDRPKLDARLQGFVDRTLGGSLETVDSEVRKRLNRACEELGITEFSVTTGATTARGTPARKEFNRPDERRLRDEPDCVEVQATVSASASASQIYGLIFRIGVEPWDKRIESIRLDPSADGERLRAVIRMATPFLPGRSPKVELALSPEALAGASRYGALFGSNPFRIPPPPAVAATPTAGTGAATAVATPVGDGLPVAIPASPFPYGEWLLTGVVEGPSGAEAWLRHLTTGAQLTVLPGTAVGELVFRAVEYDFAVFDGPLGVCKVQVGNNLTQRS
jgi:phage baseplate assembly protein W